MVSVKTPCCEKAATALESWTAACLGSGTLDDIRGTYIEIDMVN